MEKILIVADPLASLKQPSDSSLALAQGFLELGHQVFWATVDTLYIQDNAVWISNTDRVVAVIPTLAAQEGETNVALNSFTRILIEKIRPLTPPT